MCAQNKNVGETEQTGMRGGLLSSSLLKHHTLWERRCLVAFPVRAIDARLNPVSQKEMVSFVCKQVGT